MISPCGNYVLADGKWVSRPALDWKEGSHLAFNINMADSAPPAATPPAPPLPLSTSGVIAQVETPAATRARHYAEGAAAGALAKAEEYLNSWRDER